MRLGRSCSPHRRGRGRLGRGSGGGAEGAPALAVRLGFRMIKGLGEEAAEKLAQWRSRSGQRMSLSSLMSVAGLRRDQMVRLAAAGAFAGYGLSRREAIWRIQGMGSVDFPLLALVAEPEEPDVCLPVATQGEEMLTDYAALGLSLGYHPLGLARSALQKRGILSSKDIKSTSPSRRVTVAGMVITRQRPSTASGVVFLTLEDELGHINVVVWPRVYERFRSLARDDVLLEVDGQVQREGSVIHVVARRFRRLQVVSNPPETRPRSFR